MSEKVQITAVFTFDADLSDTDSELMQIDRIYEAAQMLAPANWDLNNILGWDPVQ